MNAWLHAHKDHTETAYALTMRDEVLACGHEVQHGGPALAIFCTRVFAHTAAPGLLSRLHTTDPNSWAFACRSKVM